MKNSHFTEGIYSYLQTNLKDLQIKNAEQQKQLAKTIVNVLHKDPKDYEKIYNYISGVYDTPYMVDEETHQYYIRKGRKKNGGIIEDLNKVYTFKQLFK